MKNESSSLDFQAYKEQEGCEMLNIFLMKYSKNSKYALAWTWGINWFFLKKEIIWEGKNGGEERRKEKGRKEGGRIQSWKST